MLIYLPVFFCVGMIRDDLTMPSHPEKKFSPHPFHRKDLRFHFALTRSFLASCLVCPHTLKMAGFNSKNPSPGFTRKSGAAFTAIYEKAQPQDDKLMASVNAGNPKKLKAWRIHRRSGGPVMSCVLFWLQAGKVTWQ